MTEAVSGLFCLSGRVPNILGIELLPYSPRRPYSFTLGQFAGSFRSRPSYALSLGGVDSGRVFHEIEVRRIRFTNNYRDWISTDDGTNAP